MKVKIKYINKLIPRLEVIKKGDWIDLSTVYRTEIQGPTSYKGKVTINDTFMELGVAMQLPKGYEAVVLPRSSTYKKHGILLANSQGVIDNTYCGDNDYWKFQGIALKDVDIPQFTRIAQFKIQLSQFATPWQKLKWLFTRKIEFVEVDHLGNEDRGGFGSTDKK